MKNILNRNFPAAIFILLTLFTISTMLLGETAANVVPTAVAAAVPTVSPATASTTPALPSWFSFFADFGALAIPGWVGVVIPFLSEFVVRIWPTKNPTSFFYLASQLCAYLSAGLHTIGAFLDNFAQSSKNPTPPGPLV